MMLADVFRDAYNGLAALSSLALYVSHAGSLREKPMRFFGDWDSSQAVSSDQSCYL